MLNGLLFFASALAILRNSNCSYVSQLSPDYPIEIFEFQSNSIQIENDLCGGYGIWSKYVPLSNTVQVGFTGILQSNCFHLHNAQEQTTQRINLLVYECPDYKTKTIYKYVQFIDNNGVDHIQEILIQDTSYEYVWNFIGFDFIPSQNRFIIYYFQQDKQIFTKEFQIGIPFYDQKLNLIFGGDLNVNKDQQLHHYKNENLSYFPGQMLILHYYQYNIEQYCENTIIQISNSHYEECRCKSNIITDISDKVIQYQDQFLFIAKYTNCQEFLLSGWIRINEIHSFAEEFLYRFIKLSGNFAASQLLDDNLSAFTLTYKISQNEDQIIITTYSYNFPSVNINFSNDPYLVKRIFNIENNIKLWHYLIVRKQETNIQVQIKFYEGFNQEIFEINQEVKQFNEVQFKLHYGNIFQSSKDYLIIQMKDFQLFNCPENDEPYINCHITCKECDGPTKYDCLSCFTQQKRIYLSDFKECICEYGTLDYENQCISLQSQNLTLIPQQKSFYKCNYGYFEFENDCFRCPSIITDRVSTCLECLQNPQGWIYILQCKTIIYSDYAGSLSQYLQDTESCYVFQQYELKHYSCDDECLDCENKQKTVSNVQQTNQLLSNMQLQLCQLGSLCQKYCYSPNFLTFEQVCTICNIKYCLYCFSYFAEDQTKTTLGQQFKFSVVGEEIKTGCAQCIEGFIYSFKFEKCVYQQPSIQNCARSFQTQEGLEICTLSLIDDFNIAPEIINCQNHILKCKNCIQTQDFIIKCLICDDGYMAQAVTGMCVECQHSNSKICVEWYSKNLEPWKWLIQSFKIQFLKIKNFYNQAIITTPNPYVLECQDGYGINQNECYKYCDDNCFQCEPIRQSFICTKCGLNYQKKNNRVQSDGKCIECSPLCQVCEERSIQEIQKLNPYFSITPENSIYTFKCIQKFPLPQISINPNLQVAYYCFNDDCNQQFEYKVEFHCRTLEYLYNTVFYGNLEDKYNYQYLNSIGLQQITLILHFNTICQPYEVKNYNFTHYFREKVFSTQQVNLRIEGELQPFLLVIEFQILYFDSITINQVLFLIRRKLEVICDNRNQYIDFNVKDTCFYSDQTNPIQIQIHGDNYLNYNLQNIQIFDAIIQDSLIFQIKNSNFIETIKITNLQLRNCILQNSTLFYFFNLNRTIIIDNLMINFCQFYSSSIITFDLHSNQKAKIIINNLNIQNSLFQESSFIFATDDVIITINRFSLSTSSIIDSNLILFSQSLQFQDVLLENNVFDHAQFLIHSSLLLINSEIKINNLYIFNNTISKFQVIIMGEKQENKYVHLSLFNFNFEDNIPKLEDNNEYLFKINSYFLEMQNIILKNTSKLQFFSLTDVSTITMKNLIYENKVQNYRVAIKFNCLENRVKQSTLLQVNGFSKITLHQFRIINQFSIDYSLISILFNQLLTSEVIEYIDIKDMLFQGNILIKKNLGVLFSLILIYSENPQNISIEDVQFQENIFHVYQTDPSENSASLIKIESGQSKIRLKNINCAFNALTNSSNSFISIFSNEILIENFKTSNHNQLEVEYWNKYFDIQIQQFYNENQIIFIIKNTFNIETIGGVFSITTSKLNFTNGQFNNIIASSSLIFQITLQGNGIVIISNCDITNAYNQQISKSQVDGAITIDARKSLLKISIDNLTLRNVQNRISSSIFSIYPSSITNDISLNKIYAQNCFSLLNQLLNLEFDYLNVELNTVQLQNLHVVQAEAEFMFFLQSIGSLNPVEIIKIIQNNAIINIIGCQLQMKDIIIEGIIISSILKIVDYNSIILTNTLFYNISTFYPINFIEFQQKNVLQSYVYLLNVTISNSQVFQFRNSLLNMQDDLIIDFNPNLCNLINYSVKNSPQKSESIYRFFDEVLKNSIQQGSLISIQSITNRTGIFIRDLKISNNNCQHCWNGLLYFDLVEIKDIKIQDFQCIMNSIKRNGCILAQSEVYLDRQIFIDRSIITQNKGTKGAGVQVINLRLSLQNSRVVDNFAIEKGGGIYYNQNSERFKITKTIISHNYAKEGGGIYLEGNSSLNSENFNRSLLLQNKAKFPSQNIHELPSHLAMQVNYQEMHSIEKIINNQSIYTLYINPYKIISQDKLVKTNYLTIPSGQTVANYQLYNSKIQKYLSYFNDFSIIFKNSMNEVQFNYLDSQCNLTQELFDTYTQTVVESTKLQSILYNTDTNKFNIGQQTFTFDPYQQNDNVYQILIECKSEQIDNILSYKLQVKSFLCQLGEFYISGGCQKCQSNQGFYSVTLNTTKCSIFDKTKFVSITSNQIQLKPGYWRPNYYSDYIELCYKNTKQCLGGWSVNDDTCNIGYIGGLCEECDQFNIKGDGQFFKNQQQLDCQQCQQLSKRILAFFLISFWAIFSTLLTVRSIEKSNQLFTQLKLRQKFAEILFNLDQDHESILLKLFLNYLWIFSLIFTFNISFSFSLGFLKQSSDTSYFMANYFECFLFEIEGIEIIYSRIIITLILILSQILIINTGYKLLSLFIGQKFQSRIVSITTLYLYIQNYASLINQLFSILAVRKISQINYIQGDVSLLYGSNNHIQWIYGFVVPGSILIGLILPFSLFIFLYSNTKLLNQIRLRRHIGYLYNEYTRINYFWEWIKLWKKTIIIIILIYFETDIFLKASLLGLCLLIYQFFSSYFKPYILLKHNILDIQTSQLCSGAIFLAAVKYQCEQQENQSISVVIQTIIMLISLILSYPFIINILKASFKKYKPEILLLLYKILHTHKPSSQCTKYFRKSLDRLNQKQLNLKKNISKLRHAIIKKKQIMKLDSNSTKDQYVQFTIESK